MRIDVNNFHLSFGEHVVIENLSFTVEPGETFGFLGSNGSGKTTTLRVLLGMRPATRGELLINGRPFRPGADDGVGYLPEERGLYRKEPVMETMVYFGRAKGLARARARAWAESYLERVGLADKSRSKLETLSGGQQQKVQLGIALLGEPRLLILDEPAKGLDPVGRQLLMDLIGERQRDGATVVLVTHDMSDVERLCDRALLLRDGRAAAYGTIAGIQAQFGPRTLSVRASSRIPDSDLYTLGRQRNGERELYPAPGARDEAILEYLVTTGARPSEFRSRPISMDEVFVRLYGENAFA